MIEIAQLVIIGIIVGSIIGLGAMGLTLVYGVFKFANFAHADLMTLGMYLAFFVYVDLGLSVGHIGPFSFGWGMIAAVLFAWAGSRRSRSGRIGSSSGGCGRARPACSTSRSPRSASPSRCRPWCRRSGGSAPLRYHNEINEACRSPAASGSRRTSC